MEGWNSVVEEDQSGGCWRQASQMCGNRQQTDSRWNSFWRVGRHSFQCFVSLCLCGAWRSGGVIQVCSMMLECSAVNAACDTDAAHHAWSLYELRFSDKRILRP